MFRSEENDAAFESAKSWMDKNPNFDPKFSRIANVVTNGDEATKAMTKEVLAEAGVDGEFPFSMAEYAFDVLGYKSNLATV